MPVEVTGTHEILPGHILGTFDPHRNTIQHVGILVEQNPVTLGPGQEATVVDMGPPLLKGKMAADALGKLVDLTRDEAHHIERIARELQLTSANLTSSRKERFELYIVYPAIKPEGEFSDGMTTTRRIRFSCAGFVAYCYYKANRTLLHLHDLPRVYLNDLKQVWSSQARLLDIEQRRAEVGLGGTGPWPVLLPAYLMHAIHAHDCGEALPFSPVAQHKSYP